MTDTASPIVTPEAVVLDFETAGVGSRSVAKLLDVLAQGVAILAIIMIVSVGAAAGSEEVAVVVVIVAAFIIIVGYPVVIEWLWNGKTLGKAAMGVRAVTREGAPIRFRHAALRGMIGLVEVYAFGFIAVLTAALSRHDQRVGDLAAGTIVIRERTAADHAVALSFFVPPGYETYADSIDTSALDAQQYQLIRSFLTRVLQLSPEARMAMAFRLANPIAVELDHEPPPGVGPELFLVCVAAAYQKRHGATAPSAWATPAWPTQPGWSPQGGWSAQGWSPQGWSPQSWSPQQPGWAAQEGWGPPTAGSYGWGPGGQPPYAGGPPPGQPPSQGAAPTAPPPGWSVAPAGAPAPPPGGGADRGASGGAGGFDPPA